MSLSLTRKFNEAVILTLPSGETIKVTLVRGPNGTSRLSFDAPPDVEIWREELQLKRNENA